MLENKRLLIVIDQVDRLDDVILLSPPKMSAVLFTSRHPFGLPAAFNLELKELESEDAEKVISKNCPRVESNASQLARLCCQNPLAIYLSLGLLSYDHSLVIEEFFTTLRNQTEGTKTSHSEILDLLNFLIEKIYHQLDVNTQNIFCQLGVFDGCFTESTATELLSDSEGGVFNVKEQLDTLTRINLLKFNNSKSCYEMHEILRSFASKKLSDSSGVYLRLHNVVQK